MRPRHDKDLAPFALHPLSTILALPFDTAAAPQSAMPGAMRAIPKLHTAAQVGFNPLHIFQLRQLQLSQRMPFLTYSTHTQSPNPAMVHIAPGKTSSLQMYSAQSPKTSFNPHFLQPRYTAPNRDELADRSWHLLPQLMLSA